MNIEPIIFFDMALAIFILSVALVGVVFYFSHIIKRQHPLEDRIDIALKKNADLLDDTRERAVRIIDEANSKAIDIVNKADLSTDIAKTKFNEQITRIASSQIKEFEKNSSDFIKLYGRVLQDLKSKNIEVFQNISKDIEANTMGEIKNFKDSMEKLTVSSQQMVKKKIDADYRASKKEIDNYKAEELKKFDNEIYKLLEKVSNLVLGKALSLSEHEDLIQKSLEKAKKEGAFKV